MASSHRRIMLKNLKKAHTPAARKRAAATRRATAAAKRLEETGTLPKKGPVNRGRKGEVHTTEQVFLAMAAGNPAPHFCPVCGRRCG